MRLTTKGRFAVTAMVDLALNNGGGPVTLAQISERQKISLSYLEQLFGKLRRQQLVNSTRGPGGGYTLARKTDEVSVADIILAVDEPIDATGCGGKEHCMGEDTGKCMTQFFAENTQGEGSGADNTGTAVSGAVAQLTSTFNSMKLEFLMHRALVHKI